MENTEWTCKIDHGSLGLAFARWSPDSRHILSTSDFKVCSCTKLSFLNDLGLNILIKN